MISMHLLNVIAILANGYCPFLGHSCFLKKTFRVFRGCNTIDFGASDVPFLGILVFNLNVLAKSGHATQAISGCRMSPKRTFLLSEKRFCRNRDIKRSRMAKNGPKLHNYLCGCPFFGQSYFENKCFGQNRT